MHQNVMLGQENTLRTKHKCSHHSTMLHSESICTCTVLPESTFMVTVRDSNIRNV